MNAELVFESDLLDEHTGQIEGNLPMATFRTLPSLNRLIGGVYAGLLSAIASQPSCGKTTLLGQMADDLAAQDVPVIIVSAELPAFRLVEKSLVRCGQSSLALSTITEAANGSDEYDAFLVAKADYARDIAPNVCIIDAPVSVTELGRIVGECTHLRERVPVVFLDYLQLVATAGMEVSGDERIAITNCIRALSGLAKAYSAPVFLLSSLTRSSYDKAELGLDCFGGSQGIEYSLDNALVMSPDGSTKAERQASMSLDVRHVSMRALKVRYGCADSARLVFDAAHATFLDRDAASPLTD